MVFSGREGWVLAHTHTKPWHAPSSLRRIRSFEEGPRSGGAEQEMLRTPKDLVLRRRASKSSFGEGPRSKRSAIRAPLEKGLIIHLTQSKIQGMRPFHEGAFSKADLRRASSRHQKYRCFEKGAEKNGCF